MYRGIYRGNLNNDGSAELMSAASDPQSHAIFARCPSSFLGLAPRVLDRVNIIDRSLSSLYDFIEREAENREKGKSAIILTKLTSFHAMFYSQQSLRAMAAVREEKNFFQTSIRVS